MTTLPWYEEKPLGRWRYIVTRAVFFHLPELAHDYEIYRPDGQRDNLATVRNGVLTILPGYAFDGATCGPDIASIMRAVVIHDLLCQLCEAPGWPLSRFTADRIFLRVGKKCSGTIARIYYTGIRIGGGLHRIFNPPTPAEGIAFRYL